jgi:hypothetical protein
MTATEIKTENILDSYTLAKTKLVCVSKTLTVIRIKFTPFM